MVLKGFSHTGCMTSKREVFVLAGHATLLALPLTLHDGQLATMFMRYALNKWVAVLINEGMRTYRPYPFIKSFLT